MEGVHEQPVEVRTDPNALPEGQDSRSGTKAALLNRWIAKCVDLLIVAALTELPFAVGFYAALTYLLIADGLWGGRSIGKRLIGLRAIILSDRRSDVREPDAGPQGPVAEGCSFRESILRNAPLAVAYGLSATLPYVGWVVGLVVMLVEVLLMIGNDRGQRLGDELAGTQVVEWQADHEVKAWAP